MSKTITAQLPAKRINAKSVRPARTETLIQDDAGRWAKVCDALEAEAFGAATVALTEAEAIDLLSRASNWEQIRREHFPMHGFHN